MYLVDLCCSKIIVKDVRRLKNITLLATPATVHTGITEIQHQADLYMPVKDMRGKQTTIILKGVYFDQSIKYNLISVNELANVGYESRFGQHESSNSDTWTQIKCVSTRSHGSGAHDGHGSSQQDHSDGADAYLDSSKIPIVTGK